MPFSYSYFVFECGNRIVHSTTPSLTHPLAKSCNQVTNQLFTNYFKSF